MSNIRVTYSGLIAFGVSMLGVVTGLIFVIIVTRRLSQEDFGLWTLIGSVISYVGILDVVTYWTTRQIARGESVGKTSLFTIGLISIVGLVIYLFISSWISSSLKENLSILLLAAFLIPLTFLNGLFNSISLGCKPQSISYGIIVFELTKIPLGFIFVVMIPLGISGVLIATIGASALKMAVLMFSIRNQLNGKIKRMFIKFWFRMSWLSLYQGAYSIVWKLDVMVYSLIASSLVGVAYFGVATTIAGLISNSNSISQALYPKLLANGKKEIAYENMKRTMYFAIPLLGATIVFAKPILNVLNPLYIDGIFIVTVMTLRSFLSIISGFFYNILSSYENIDLDKQASFRKYLKSNLTLLPTLNLLQSIAYICSLATFLIFVTNLHLSEVFKVTIWSIILLLLVIPIMIYGMILVKRKYQIVLPYIHIAKYAVATLFSSALIFLISEYTIKYTKSIFDFIPQLIPLVILGGAVYFGITYIIDDSTKKLFKSIISEMWKK